MLCAEFADRRRVSVLQVVWREKLEKYSYSVCLECEGGSKKKNDQKVVHILRSCRRVIVGCPCTRSSVFTLFEFFGFVIATHERSLELRKRSLMTVETKTFLGISKLGWATSNPLRATSPVIFLLLWRVSAVPMRWHYYVYQTTIAVRALYALYIIWQEYIIMVYILIRNNACVVRTPVTTVTIFYVI